jgi:hypothetical protein
MGYIRLFSALVNFLNVYSLYSPRIFVLKTGKHNEERRPIDCQGTGMKQIRK